MARQGWWLFGPISARGGGLGARAPSRRARGVKKGGAWTVRVWSGKERGDRAAMEALIAMRERGWGLVCAHMEGKERGVRAWTTRGVMYGQRCQVAHGSGRGRERGSWQVAYPAGLALPDSERRRERERTDRWVWVACGPGFKWIKNNPDLIQTCPNLI
jgi:hypothetical protein